MATGRIAWKRLPIDKPVLKELTKRSDAKAFKQVGIQILVTILLGVLSYWAFKNLSLWASIPIYLTYTTVYSFMGYTAAIHELCHSTVFKTKWLNEAFMILFSIFSWSDYVLFKASHMKHHHFTTHDDLDLEVILPVSITGSTVFNSLLVDFDKVTGFLSGIPGIIRRALGNLSGEWENRLMKDNEKLHKKMIKMNRITILFQLSIVVLAVVTGEYLLLLLITFAVFFGNWLNYLFKLTQHAGMHSNSTDFRLNCRSMTLNPVYGFLYWQMHYHVEHHMYAAVPFYNLPKLYKVLKDELPERKNLIGTWLEIIDLVKKQKADPTYVKEVVLPNN